MWRWNAAVAGSCRPFDDRIMRYTLGLYPAPRTLGSTPSRPGVSPWPAAGAVLRCHFTGRASWLALGFRAAAAFQLRATDLLREAEFAPEVRHGLDVQLARPVLRHSRRLFALETTRGGMGNTMRTRSVVALR